MIGTFHEQRFSCLKCRQQYLFKFGPYQAVWCDCGVLIRLCGACSHSCEKCRVECRRVGSDGSVR